MKIGNIVGQVLKVGLSLALMLFISLMTLGAAIGDGVVSSGASNMLYSTLCLPCGTCTGTELVEGMELESRVYSLEDAKILRALSYRDAKMINFMTVMPNVKCKERLYREELRFQFQSDATGGRGAKDCGPFKSVGDHRKPTDKFVKAFYVYIETALCYKKLIGTFKQSLLNAGARLSENNTGLNDFVITSMLRDANRQTDQLILLGDYASQDGVLSHYDGLIKIAYKAVAAGSTPAKNEYTFAGVVAGDNISMRVGGQIIEVPFNTSNDITVDDAVTALTAIVDYTATATYAVANPTAPVMTVESADGHRPIDVEVFITKGTGFDACGDPEDNGVGTVVLVVLQKVDTANDVPMSFTYEVATVANIVSIVEKISDELGARNTGTFSEDALDMDNFFVHVSPRFMGSLRIAHTKLTTAGGTSKLDNLQSEKIFGINFVEQPFIPDNVIFGAEKQNLFFATDLGSDLSQVDVWADKNTQEVKMRMEARQGVQIDRLRDILVNFGGLSWVFEADQPLGC